jgi:hypothetical protein
MKCWGTSARQGRLREARLLRDAAVLGVEAGDGVNEAAADGMLGMVWLALRNSESGFKKRRGEM